MGWGALLEKYLREPLKIIAPDNGYIRGHLGGGVAVVVLVQDSLFSPFLV